MATFGQHSMQEWNDGTKAIALYNWAPLVRIMCAGAGGAQQARNGHAGLHSVADTQINFQKNRAQKGTSHVHS